jgi:hypothetical protein
MARFKVGHIDGKPGDGTIERCVIEGRNAAVLERVKLAPRPAGDRRD